MHSLCLWPLVFTTDNFQLFILRFFFLFLICRSVTWTISVKSSLFILVKFIHFPNWSLFSYIYKSNFLVWFCKFLQKKEKKNLQCWCLFFVLFCRFAFFYVCFVFPVLSNLCKDKRIENYIGFYVNKFKFTVAIHSCMSFEALKPICMHEIVKFFSLVPSL